MTEASNTKEIERSTGRGFLMGAGAAAIVAALALLVGSQIHVEAYGAPDYAALVQRWWVFTISGCAGGLAVTLFCVGSIIRAIWFLPGDETKPIDALSSNRNSPNYYPSRFPTETPPSA